MINFDDWPGLQFLGLFVLGFAIVGSLTIAARLLGRLLDWFFDDSRRG